jgi:small glutamine-rich tetratricopeptide repeat-containing protein alpha
MNRGFQTASKKYREQYQESTSDTTRNAPSNASPSTASSGLPDLSSLASMFGGGAGGGGGGGGMPDLQGLMNNPMLMNMANQMAQSGAFDSIMNNPRMREMAQQMMSGERNLGDMMNDPEVQNM